MEELKFVYNAKTSGKFMGDYFDLYIDNLRTGWFILNDDENYYLVDERKTTLVHKNEPEWNARSFDSKQDERAERTMTQNLATTMARSIEYLDEYFIL